MRVDLLRTVIVTIASLLLGGEVFARFALGLGDPPLSIAHPSIEYLLKADQDVRRFGNRFLTNAYGMRSPNFPASKDSGELRVLVFGDSVLNGGSQIDQEVLATSRLAERLARIHSGPVVVGNVSASSWGPGNWLAYALEFGFFDADAVILVISSHDAADHPTFAPLDATMHPTMRPWSALVEGITRYLPAYLARLGFLPERSDASETANDLPSSESLGQVLSDLTQFLELAFESGAYVFVAQYPEREEVLGGFSDGYALIKTVAENVGADVFPLDDAMRVAMERELNPYRDYIHASEEGQDVLATALLEVLLRGGFLREGAQSD